MSSDGNENFTSDDLNHLKQLPEFREMKMRAEAAEAKLRRIYNTPFWKFSKPLRKIYARISQYLSSKSENKFVFKPDPREGQPVVDLVRDRIALESNNANLNHESIAIVAHFSKSNVLSTSLTSYLSAILKCKYSVILVSACESENELVIDNEIKSQITILRKPNLGYDFGSWAVAIDKFPEVLLAKKLLLTNDSLIGPLDDFSIVAKALENSKFDIAGITDNSQLQYHVQSYILLFKQSAIGNLNVQNLLRSVVHLELKNEVILKYELGLTRTAQLSGLFVGAIFPWNLIVQPGKNPSLAGWKRLMDLGFPFLKREAVRLGSFSEVNEMSKYISFKYPSNPWAVNEIKEVVK